MILPFAVLQRLDCVLENASLHKDGKDDSDRFLLHLNQMLINSVKEAAASTVSCQLHTVDMRWSAAG